MLKQKFERYKKDYLALKARLEVLKENKEKISKEYKRIEQRIEDISKARVIIQQVAKDTQSKLEFHISSLVTLALQSVFPDPYEFKVEFETRRGKTECDLWFVRNNEKVRPLLDSGGGPVDVASFALRLVFWSLVKPRPVIILDEPFRFVSTDLQANCSEMLSKLSKKLGIQIIMISHLPEIITSADKVFWVKKQENISKVEER